MDEKNALTLVLESCLSSVPYLTEVLHLRCCYEKFIWKRCSTKQIIANIETQEKNEGLVDAIEIEINSANLLEIQKSP